MKCIAVYSRVSDDDQSHASQELVINRWLESSGMDLARVVWYRDVGSGDGMAREAMGRLEKDIFDGKVGTLVVYKLDRLSRKMLDGLTFLGKVMERGIRVVSVTQQIDLSGTVGKMFAAMLFGFAEMEQETRRERQRAGIEVARKNGVYFGRKPGTTKAEPARAKELLDKGYAVAEVATALGVTPRTVWRYARRAAEQVGQAS